MERGRKERRYRKRIQMDFDSVMVICYMKTFFKKATQFFLQY